MEQINPKFIKKAKFQKKIDGNLSQCLTCEKRCKIKKDKSGFCKIRVNLDDDIYTIVYGLIPALSFNPIEKKPLYHFYPGSTALTVGTYGCNFSCFWCQNHHLSHPSQKIVEIVKNSYDFLSPDRLIEIALRNDCQGTSISFNEPTLLFEYSLEVFKLAREKKLYNTYVTNGYMTEDVLYDLIEAGLDAMNIDIKGDSEMVQKYCGADVEKVWRNAKLAKDLGIHIEITTLLIDGLNSEEDIIKSLAERIKIDLGENTPYHLSRFFPHFKSYDYGFNNPTLLKSLYNAYELAKEAGLNFVYLGNLPNAKYGNTTCPNCSKTVIKRGTFSIKEMHLDSKGNCKFCGHPICKM